MLNVLNLTYLWKILHTNLVHFMYKLFKISYLIGFVFTISLWMSCQSKSDELPASYYEFPIDTTVQIIQTLPSKVKESSGIIYWKDRLWTHNDSGDDPNIYELEIETGKILETITLADATARDWEDIAQDSQYIYVSDLGNNAGKRRDLAIYKTAKSNIVNGEKEVNWEKLEVSYPDRTNYKPPAYKHNFDCEAMIAFEDSLYIFSKNHLDKHCRFYSVAKDLPKQVVQLHDRFNTKGMITGAAANKEKGVLALLGYNLDPEVGNFGAFVWLFWDYPNREFFKGKSTRVNMPFISQAEGISYWKEGKFLISTEKTRMMDGSLMVFDASKWME